MEGVDLRFIRGLTADSGDVEQLLRALKSAFKLQAGDEEALRETFREDVLRDQHPNPRRSEWSVRSAEPHTRLARNLDLIDDSGVTPVGKALLVAADSADGWRRAPFTMIVLFLQHDLHFSIPLLQELSADATERAGFADLPEEDLEARAKRAYHRMWERWKDHTDIPDPGTWTGGKHRTPLHYARARLRFFSSAHGLKLDDVAVLRLAKQLTENGRTLPADELRLLDVLYETAGVAVLGRRTQSFESNQEIIQAVVRLARRRHPRYGSISGFMACSGLAIYHLLNNELLASSSRTCGIQQLRDILRQAGFGIYQGRESYRGRASEVPGPRVSDFLIQIPESV